MANNILIVNTIKHLRLKQIYYQLYYRLFSHKLMEYNVPRQSSLRMVSVIAKWYCYNVPKTFTFLNLIGVLSHGMMLVMDALGIQSELYGLVVAT